MENELIWMVFLPWLVFLILGILIPICAVKLVTWAKKRKRGAIIFGALIQMFLPDPYVQQTLQIITIEEKIVKKRKATKASSDK